MNRWVLIALLVVGSTAPGRAEDGTTRVDGAHFRLVQHFEGKETARAALDQVEALWDEAAGLYGLPKGALEKKLQVHLYRDATDYEVAEEKLTKGAFKRNLAFAHFDTLAAHVALQPAVTDVVLERVGLPALTRIMLLHEAAHLVRYSTMANFRSHPDWLADGAAMHLKHRIVSGDHPEADPLASTDVVRIQRLRRKGELPGPAAILSDQVDDLQFYDRYAVRWAFFRFLVEKHGAALKETIKRTRRLGGGSKLGEKVTDLLRERIGRKGFAALDTEWPAFVEALEPEWDEVWRSLSPDPRRRIQIAFPDTNAIAWRTSPTGKDAYGLSATVTILDNYRHQVNLLLDRSDSGFVCVAFNAGLGVTLFDYRSKEDRWNRLKFVARKGLATGKPFKVAVRVKGSRLRLRIDGDSVLDEEIAGRTMAGPWGLGALSGSAGIWEDLRLN